MSSCWTTERWTKDGGTKQVAEHGPKYYKGRGEQAPSVKHKNLKEFLTATDECNGEYAYLFVNDEWICYDPYEEVQIPIPAAKVAA